MSAENGMTTILHNAAGDVQLYNQGQPTARVQIPSGLSAIGVLGNPNVMDLAGGDRFDDTDWWQYRNGVRYRKWMVEFGSYKRIWKPGLDPVRLVRLWRRTTARCNHAWARLAREGLIALGDAERLELAQPMPKGHLCWLSIFRSTEDWALGFGCSFGGAPEPDLPVAPKPLVDAVRYWENTSMRCGGAYTLLKAVLEEKVKASSSRVTIGHPVPVHILLDGDDFWFSATRTTWGNVAVAMIGWPGEDRITLDLGGNRK